MVKKSEVFGAILLPGEGVANFVIGQLLNGLKIQVVAGGKILIAHINRIDMAKGTDHLFADAYVPTPMGQKDLDIKVSINRAGDVTIIPDTQ
jgi:hypothetical protein